MTITSQQVDAWDAEVDAAYASGVAAGAAREQRPWVGLTGQEKALIAAVSLDVHDAVHRTDAKLKEKNT